MRRIVTSGLAALAILLGGAGQAAAAPAPAAPTAGTVLAGATPSGVRVPAAVPGTLFSIGSKISCGSPRACLAVGSNSSNSSGNSSPVAEAWNGKAWRSVAVKAPKGASSAALTGVSCKSASSCLVVGDYETNSGSGTPLPYAMTWNGTSLKPTAALPVPKGDDFLVFGAVSCVTARSCIAVGVSISATSLPVTPLLVVGTWNGAKWGLRTARNPGGSGSVVPELTAISCSSVTSCVAAGTSVSVTGTEKLLLVTWNGKAFTAIKAAVPVAPNGIQLLNDVSCTSAKRCVAVGISLNSAGTSGFGFTEVLNGTSWKTAKIAPPKGDTASLPFGVSCMTATSCIAVGTAVTAKASGATALSYNGRTWSRLSVPGPGKGKSSVFTGVSCPKVNDCVAIGEVTATNGTSATLAGLWNGKTWKVAAA